MGGRALIPGLWLPIPYSFAADWTMSQQFRIPFSSACPPYTSLTRPGALPLHQGMT